MTVPPEGVDELVASCWLHDIGYAPALRYTGFHPLDGVPDGPNALANPDRDEYIRDAARRVVNRLVELGQSDAYLDV